MGRFMPGLILLQEAVSTVPVLAGHPDYTMVGLLTAGGFVTALMGTVALTVAALAASTKLTLVIVLAIALIVIGLGLMVAAAALLTSA